MQMLIDIRVKRIGTDEMHIRFPKIETRFDPEDVFDLDVFQKRFENIKNVIRETMEACTVHTDVAAEKDANADN